MFHHARPLVTVHHGSVWPERASDRLLEPICPTRETTDCEWTGDRGWHAAVLWHEPAANWLSEQVGFYPLWLAIGAGEQAQTLQMTGYQHNWSQLDADEQALLGRDQLLFSWSVIPQPELRFLSHDAWWRCLQLVYQASFHQAKLTHVPARHRQALFHPERGRYDWLRIARRDPAAVSAVVPGLDLASAEIITCPNQRCYDLVAELGFAAERIIIRQLPAE